MLSSTAAVLRVVVRWAGMGQSSVGSYWVLLRVATCDLEHNSCVLVLPIRVANDVDLCCMWMFGKLCA